MAHDLDSLIQRIEAGSATPAELEVVRGELATDAWPVADLRAAVLAGGRVDVSAAVMAAIGAEIVPLSEAVRSEAGDVELAADVLAQLEIEVQGATPLAAAIEDEGGLIDLADAVMGALDIEQLPLGEAVRGAAGDADVADAVMAKLGTSHAMPDPVRAAPEMPAPANGRRWLGVVLAAAMALMVIGAGSLMAGGAMIGSMVTTGAGAASGGSVEIAGLGGHQLLDPAEMVFASAAEVVVDDLSFGDDVVVFQDEGDDGALILWVDEEVL